MLELILVAWQIIRQHMLQPHVGTLVDKGLPTILDDFLDTGAATVGISSVESIGGADKDVVGVSRSSSEEDKGRYSSRAADMKRMFTLLESIGALDALKTGWGSYIR